MPAVLKVKDTGIYRYKDENSTTGEVVSNFTIALLGTVHIDRDAGGPGFLAKIKRFPDEVAKEVFVPMGELSGSVNKQLCSYLNQVFPGGALFLLASDGDLKRLLMELTAELLNDVGCRNITASRIIGVNSTPNKEDVWVFSPKVAIHSEGRFLDRAGSPVMWLERPARDSTNQLITDSLICHIPTPLDGGESLRHLIVAIQSFMPENFVSAMAAMACCMMGASYKEVIKESGCCGVPILYGEAGCCKSEALKCGLALFGAERTHLYNSQTTPSFLFETLKQTTIPLGIDDISEKASDSWEELCIDSYNNTPRGTRAYKSEKFNTLPVATANWQFNAARERGHTRTIIVPFYEHIDEPQATHLYTALNQARAGTARSVAAIIPICHFYASAEGQLRMNEVIHPHVSQVVASSHARFRTTLSTFMYFFLELAKLSGSYLTEEQCWEFLAVHMAPLTSSQPLEGSRVLEQYAGFEGSTLEKLFQTLAEHAQNIPKYKLLQCIAVDVKTRGHLGDCVAIKVKEVLDTLQAAKVDCHSISRVAVEAEMKTTSYCRKSQQKFLNAISKDSRITGSVRGLGGNATTQRCFLVEQSRVNEELVSQIREALEQETPRSNVSTQEFETARNSPTELANLPQTMTEPTDKDLDYESSTPKRQKTFQ